MSNTSHNYFNKVDPFKGSYVTYNERDINDDYLVLFQNEPWRSTDPLQSGIESLTYGPAPIRKDASSFYTRQGLPIVANEEIPITFGNYALRAPDIQFVQEHRVLPPQDMYLKTNTELEMELQVYHDGVKKQAASGIDTAHSRERIFEEFKQRMQYAESIPQNNTIAREAYENQAVNFLLANDPQLYMAIYGGSADKARSAHPSHITITSATHEAMAKSEKQARQKELEELAKASSTLRESRKKVSESLEGSLGGTPNLSPIPSPKRGESKTPPSDEKGELKTPPSDEKGESKAPMDITQIAADTPAFGRRATDLSPEKFEDQLKVFIEAARNNVTAQDMRSGGPNLLNATANAFTALAIDQMIINIFKREKGEMKEALLLIEEVHNSPKYKNLYEVITGRSVVSTISGDYNYVQRSMKSKGLRQILSILGIDIAKVQKKRDADSTISTVTSTGTSSKSIASSVFTTP